MLVNNARFVVLPRNLFEIPCLKSREPLSPGSLILWLFLHAERRKRKIWRGGRWIQLQRGQLIGTTREWAPAWNMSKSNAWRMLRTLADENFVSWIAESSGSNKCTIITVTDYAKHTTTGYRPRRTGAGNVLSFAAYEAKRELSRIRRREFASEKPALALAMLDAGIEYRCADAVCDRINDLTIDHKVPLSRGGTDAISNLQFMCQAHNSAKSDRPD